VAFHASSTPHFRRGRLRCESHPSHTGGTFARREANRSPTAQVPRCSRPLADTGPIAYGAQTEMQIEIRPRHDRVSALQILM